MNALDFLRRVLLAPGNASDVLLNGLAIVIILIIPFLTALLVKWPKWIWLWLPSTIFIGLVYCCFMMIIKPFNNKEFGVLLLNTSGASLEERFGKEDRFNDMLLTELNITKLEFESKWKLIGLDKILRFKAVSWKAKSYEDAMEYQKKYRAKAVFWGQIKKSQEIAELSYYLVPGHITYIVENPGQKPASFSIQEITGPDFTLPFGDTGDSMRCFSQKIINRLLPPLAIVTFNQGNPTLAAEIIKIMPSVDQRYKTSDYAGFILLVGAEALKATGQIKQAAEVYRLSYEALEQYKYRSDSGKASISIDERRLRQFGTAVKWSEAVLAIQLGDRERAIACYKIAAATDRSLKLNIEKDAESEGLIIRDWTIDLPNSPFVGK